MVESRKIREGELSITVLYEDDKSESLGISLEDSDEDMMSEMSRLAQDSGSEVSYSFFPANTVDAAAARLSTMAECAYFINPLHAADSFLLLFNQMGGSNRLNAEVMDGRGLSSSLIDVSFAEEVLVAKGEAVLEMGEGPSNG